MRFRKTQGAKTQAFFETQGQKLKVFSKTQGIGGFWANFQRNSRYWRFSCLFQTWIFWRILPISSETRYQRYLLIAILQIKIKRHVFEANFEKTQCVCGKTSTKLKKLNEFLKNSRKKLKTQGKNSSYRRFPPHVIAGKTPKKKPGSCSRFRLILL